MNIYTIDENLKGLKLFEVCRILYPSFSKRQLHECFKIGKIKLNDTCVKPGHDDETKRVKKGDKVGIVISVSDMKRAEISHFNLNIIKNTPFGVVVQKPAGMAMSNGSKFFLSVVSNMNQDINQISEVRKYSPFYLEKCLAGTVFFTRHPSSTNSLRLEMLGENPKLKLYFLAIICGGLNINLKSGEFINFEDLRDMKDKRKIDIEAIEEERKPIIDDGSDINDEDDADEDDLYNIKNSSIYHESHSRNPIEVKWKLRILSQVRSISQDFLTQVELEPQFLPRKHLDSSIDLFYHLSRCIKALRYGLRNAGNPIVGDKNYLKKSKGVFLCLKKLAHLDDEEGRTQTSALASLSSISESTFEMKEPEKFNKLLHRERLNWMKARHQAKCSQEGKEEIEETEQTGKAMIGDQSTLNGAAIIFEDNYPLEYQNNKAFFFSHTFFVNENVMIPRKSSEVLVSTAKMIIQTNMLDIIDRPTRSMAQPIRILDLGCGSGCLLLSTIAAILADTPADAQLALRPILGVGVDISQCALKVASINSSLLGLASQTKFIKASFHELPSVLLENHIHQPDHWQPIDVILCNPPYSSIDEKGRLSSYRVKYEPTQALFADSSLERLKGLAEDPKIMDALDQLGFSLFKKKEYLCYIDIAQSLATLRRLSTENSPTLSSEFHLILEVGLGQAKIVSQIFTVICGEFLELVNSVQDHNAMMRCLVWSRIMYEH